MNLKEFENEVKKECAGKKKDELVNMIVMMAGMIREADRGEALKRLAGKSVNKETQIRSMIAAFEEKTAAVNEGEIKVLYEYYEDWGDPEAYMDGGYVTKYTETAKAQYVYDTGTKLLHMCADRSMYAEAMHVYELMENMVLICEDEDSGDETEYTFDSLMSHYEDFLELDRKGIQRDLAAVRAHLHA